MTTGLNPVFRDFIASKYICPVVSVTDILLVLFSNMCLVRQGFPFSLLLHILTIEILLQKLKSLKDVFS